MRCLFVIYILLPIWSLAQSIDYSSVDNKAKSLSKKEAASVKLLAEAVNKNTKTEDESVRFIASWIYNNIKFKNTFLVEERMLHPVSSNRIIKNKTANRYDIAQLFNDVCDASGLSSEIVVGYLKDVEYEPYDTVIGANHCWNAVRINNKWYLIDLLFSSGHFKAKARPVKKIFFKLFGTYYEPKYRFVKQWNENFYKAKPQLLINSHLPLNPYWQLLDHTVSHDIFINEKVKNKYQLKGEFYNYNDSISHYLRLQYPHNLIDIGENAFSFNPKNHVNYGVGLHKFALSETQITIQNSDEINTKLTVLDSNIRIIDSAVVCYNIFKDDCSDLKSFHIDKNKEFYRYTKDDLKHNSRNDLKKQRYYRKYTNKLNTIARKTKNIKKYLAKEKSQISSEKFNKAHSRGKKTEEEDKYYIMAVKAELDHTKDLILKKNNILNLLVNDTVPMLFNRINSERQKITSYVNYGTYHLIKDRTWLRRYFSWVIFDNFISYTDSVNAIQASIDSSYRFIIEPSKIYIYKVLYELKSNCRKINKLYDKIYDYLVDMKKNGEDIASLTEMYETAMSDHEAFFNYYIDQNNKFLSYLKKERKSSLKLSSIFKKQNRFILKEIRIEKKRYDFYQKKYKSKYRTDYLHYKTLVGVAKSDKKIIKENQKAISKQQ